MTNQQIYNMGMNTLRAHGSIHGELREFMIDFQLDGYEPEQEREPEEQEQTCTEGAE